MTNAPTTRETADHAELAALVQDLRNSRTVWDNARARPKEIETRAADALENLLSEIAALRDYGRDVAKEALEYRRQRDELRKALEPSPEMIRVGAWRAKLHREANPGDTWEDTVREAFSIMVAASDADVIANQGPDQ